MAATSRAFDGDGNQTETAVIEVPALPGAEAGVSLVPSDFPEEIRPARDPIERDRRQALVGGLATMGYSNAEIAGIARLTVRQVEVTKRQLRDRKAIAEGIEESIARVDGEAIPLAVDSMIEHLRKQDKEMTIEALKGRGIFKTHVNQKNTGDPVGTNRSFNINIVVAPNQQAAQVAAAATPLGIGAPRLPDTIDVPAQDEA